MDATAGGTAAARPPLSVRVMRMSVPALAQRTVPLFETEAEGAPALSAASAAAPFDASIWDAVKGTYARNKESGTAEYTPVRDVPYLDQLSLPSSFGAVAVGDAFRALVCITNESDRPITGVSVDVDMHVPSPGHSGAAERPPPPRAYRLASAPAAARSSASPGATCTLGALEPLTVVVVHELHAIGPHALVCHVRSAAPGTAETHRFSKQYRFSVNPPPFVMRSTAHAPESLSCRLHADAAVRERTVLQVQLQNVSPMPLVVDALDVDTASVGGAWCAARVEGASDAALFAGADRFLQPKDVRQYLFALTPTAAEVVSRGTWARLAELPPSVGEGMERSVSLSLPLGKVRIAWRVPGGEPGELAIGPMTRPKVLPRPVAVAVGGMGHPRTAHLVAELHRVDDARPVAEQPFPLALRVTVRDVGTGRQRAEGAAEAGGPWEGSPAGVPPGVPPGTTAAPFSAADFAGATPSPPPAPTRLHLTLHALDTAEGDSWRDVALLGSRTTALPPVALPAEPAASAHADFVLQMEALQPGMQLAGGLVLHLAGTDDGEDSQVHWYERAVRLQAWAHVAELDVRELEACVQRDEPRGPHVQRV
ncbi:hypothetical protein MSPP1_000145 [Malassezia sp. CBS 17886]|nr:hypothetical protein MSPP1_000145 [Malassezia sp. CBS 17886]